MVARQDSVLLTRPKRFDLLDLFVPPNMVVVGNHFTFLLIVI